jgi:predicted flap endonuclease-1-like 5' DNA nuclease
MASASPVAAVSDVAEAAPAASLAARPSVVPGAPATPPPPPLRASLPPSYSRPHVYPSGGSATAQLEQRLGAVQLEVRKLGSERHSLRARLRRESDRVRELESALRAEKELHQSAVTGLRARLASLEAEKEAERARLEAELREARAAKPVAAPSVPPAVAAKTPQGLRRIRGIGPAFQRALENLGVTRVEQIAAWSPADITSFADKLKIRPDRVTKDDWVGQAKRLGPES